MGDSFKELLQFIQLGARQDCKFMAIKCLLRLTGSEPGIAAILETPGFLVSLISLLDDNSAPIAEDAALCLINISASEKGAAALLNVDLNKNCPPLQKPPEDVVRTALKFVFDPESKLADPCCMVLSNLTRPGHLIEKVVELVEKSGKEFDDVINVFTKNEYNKHGAKLHYLGAVLSNLSQSVRIRRYILDKNKCVIQRLLPFTEYKESLVRRGGVVGTLKNCCFETDCHDWLLGDDVDILPRLLLPLAGNEEFDEEDNDKLPMDLQYLPEDKAREEDPDIRCILLEALTQLCSKRQNREFMRDKNAYIILRELHKWEKDRKALLVCENLINILIRTEEEIGEDDLKEIEVPEHLHDNFKRDDEEFLNDETVENS